jgi:hypothetical protein
VLRDAAAQLLSMRAVGCATVEQWPSPPSVLILRSCEAASRRRPPGNTGDALVLRDSPPQHEGCAAKLIVEPDSEVTSGILSMRWPLCRGPFRSIGRDSGNVRRWFHHEPPSQPVTRQADQPAAQCSPPKVRLKRHGVNDFDHHPQLVPDRFTRLMRRALSLRHRRAGLPRSIGQPGPRAPSPAWQ